MRNELARLFYENPILLTGTDWLIKSLAILIIAFIIGHLAKRAKLGSSANHSLWMFSLISLGLIPIAGFTLDAVSTAPVFSGNIFTLTAVAEYSAQPVLTAAASYSVADLLLYFYLLSVAVLLLRILVGVIAVLRISNASVLISSGKIREAATRLTTKFDISRSVKIKQSPKVTSPFSYGIFFPEIILPEQAIHWSESTLESVLTHELIHIKRLDWLSMLICHVVASGYWINPLCWIALNRANEEAELSCDAAVLTHGLNRKSYAESLVYVARQSRDEHRLLVQMMAQKRQLPKRIDRIMEGSVNNASVTRKFRLQLVAALLLLLGLFSDLHLISAQSASDIQALSVANDGSVTSITVNPDDGGYRPLTSIAPQYPTRAAQRGITGWSLVRFNVNEDGNVDEDSIVVVDSEPSDIFDRSSIRAAARFKFHPHTENGESVGVSGVQYVFRYDLDGSNLARQNVGIKNREYLPLNYITPQYPPSARQENLEGYVLVEFTVTDQGMPSGIVILDRSPSDIFNASAIHAAERFRFEPRIMDGVPVEVEGAQYLFNFKP